MTSRLVVKWKKASDANGKPTTIIRMRMTLRGFMDRFAHEHDGYAGTATRNPQNSICSEVACHEDMGPGNTGRGDGVP